ncbi:hypothetical protein WKR88_15760 [Trinickia caryophylli]|uniref:hypothetical protein n=1 Tax=Trinickia caryophylli TaxID=28094 RepID=UPI000A16355D|nr:hypothetical protein [Trinickia caryophylli]TRX15195.1 hypothetical protein FNF07_28835 [Trinickia caryophylli]WQE15064.1 hypothetical protein U0034_21155 [Trinickia caryophylli]
MNKGIAQPCLYYQPASLPFRATILRRAYVFSFQRCIQVGPARCRRAFRYNAAPFGKSARPVAKNTRNRFETFSRKRLPVSGRRGVSALARTVSHKKEEAGLVPLVLTIAKGHCVLHRLLAIMRAALPFLAGAVRPR